MRKTADRLKKEHGTRDPFKICRALGMILLPAELPPTTGGLFFLQDGRRIVLINRSLTEPRARFACAHELGHAVLHEGMNGLFLQDSTYFVPGRLEREADEFAACLLIDPDLVADPQYEGFSTAQLSAVFGVPEQLIPIAAKR